MCAFCAMLSAGGAYWTEAGTDAGHLSEVESGRSRYFNRPLSTSLKPPTHYWIVTCPGTDCAA